MLMKFTNNPISNTEGDDFINGKFMLIVLVTATAVVENVIFFMGIF